MVVCLHGIGIDHDCSTILVDRLLGSSQGVEQVAEVDVILHGFLVKSDRLLLQLERLVVLPLVGDAMPRLLMA